MTTKDMPEPDEFDRIVARNFNRPIDPDDWPSGRGAFALFASLFVVAVAAIAVFVIRGWG